MAARSSDGLQEKAETLSHRIDFLQKFTAVNADVLAGSALDPIPRDGFVRVYATEIVDTGRIQIDPALHMSPTGAGVQHIPEGAGADSGAAPNHPVILLNQPHWETEVSKGEKVAIALSGTISECLVNVTFMGA